METQKSKSRVRRHILNLTLVGLPELEYFESDAQREKALSEIGEESADVKSGGYWSAIGILVAVVLGSQALVRWLLHLVVWPALLEATLIGLVTLVAFVLTLRLLHRWGTAGQLRTKLIACGVPVCLKCGYLLRGLPLKPGRCPECGCSFSEPVCKILGGKVTP